MPTLIQCRGDATKQFEKLKAAALNKHLKLPNGCWTWAGDTQGG